MTGILLADVHRSFVESLAMLLDAHAGLHVVGAVTRADEVLQVVRSRPVDVAVLTVDGGREDLLALATALLAARPDLKLVAVAEADDVAVLARAIRGGFRAWVHKSDGVAGLVDVLGAVLRDETRIPPPLLTGLLAHLVRGEQEKCAVEKILAALTVRERQVLDALVTGSTRQEIAEDLEISLNTVRTHLQSILRKLGVHTSLAAVTLVRRGGAA